MTIPRGRLIRGATAAGILIVIALAAATPYAGTALVVSAPVASPDAIVSLASHEWERLPATIDLARRYPNALVVLTVPQEVTVHNCHDCARRPGQLVNAGIQVSRLRLLQLSAPGTHGEALAARSFVVDSGLHSLLVVTSPYHTRRSLATFRAVLPPGVTVGIVPATASSPARPGRWWMSPYDRAYVAYEWTATLYYFVRYHVAVWS